MARRLDTDSWLYVALELNELNHHESMMQTPKHFERFTALTYTIGHQLITNWFRHKSIKKQFKVLCRLQFRLSILQLNFTPIDKWSKGQLSVSH